MKPTESKRKCSVTVRGHEFTTKPALLRRPAILALLLCAAVVCAALPAAAQTLTMTKGGISVSSVCVGDAVHIMLNLEGSSCDMLPTLTEAYLSNSVSATSGSDVPIWLAYDGEAGWEGDYTTTADDVGYDILYTSDGDTNDCPISPVLLTVVDCVDLEPNFWEGGYEFGSDPPTYWVAPCAEDAIVTATPNPNLPANQLPTDWTFTGGTTIDGLHHKVKTTNLIPGPVSFTVLCGSTVRTVQLETDPEKLYYDNDLPCDSCPKSWTFLNPSGTWDDPNPIFDACGNELAISCPKLISSIAYQYVFNGISVGTCYYSYGINSFLFKSTAHYVNTPGSQGGGAILRTWHLTLQGNANYLPTTPALWTVTKYDGVTGSGPSKNYRTAASWNPNWCRPADEPDSGYPGLSCENQGTAMTGPYGP
jgi:hypothetical protein